ncbi:MAG: DUF2330 domain-containing protein, partial [Acidimicrobiales bacterium]
MRPRSLLITIATTTTAAVTLATAGPAGACAGLIGPGGSVKVLRTATLAAYHHGVEHYVTSFQFEGGGAEFGSIVPLPAVPSKVERGGDWTLQRLVREVTPLRAAPPAPLAVAASAPAEVVLETRVDALDLTVLRGGGAAVGRWARDHGFALTPDAPEILDFYAERSPVFLAARFDPASASDRGQQVGDGTPIHLTIPTGAPWVPLRILGLGRPGGERVEADVFLLTDGAPGLLPAPGAGLATGLVPSRSEPASPGLLTDLRTDAGMGWVPETMWFTHLRLGESQAGLRYDLAVSAVGTAQPSLVAAGLARPAPPVTPTTTAATAPPTTTAPTTVSPTAPPTTSGPSTSPPTTTGAPGIADAPTGTRPGSGEVALGDAVPG